MAGVTLPYRQDYYSEGASDLKGCNNDLENAINNGRKLLLSLQYPEGYWSAEVEVNITFTAQTVLLYKILGIEKQYPLYKVENYLRRLQCSHGGWETFYGDGGCLDCTIEGNMALRLLDVPKTDPALQKAAAFILSRGGVAKARMFTKLCLALLGCYDWTSLPSLPPWLMLLPKWSPFNIYDMSSWARISLVPLILILHRKPVFKASPGLSFEELYTKEPVTQRLRISLHGDGDWKSTLFLGIDYAFKAMERVGLVPFKERGLKKAELWLLTKQEETGDACGIHPGMFYSILCMHKVIGLELADPILVRAVQALERFCIESQDELVVQSTVSPVWDTAFTVRSLVESGMEPDHPILQKAGEWLLKQQVTSLGDWAYNVPSACGGGGWSFQFCNRWYPDVDDTARVVLALTSIQLKDEVAKYGAIRRAVRWIRQLQSTSGGWGGYDKDNNKEWLNSSPAAVLKALIDPNTVDITASVLEMVGQLMAETFASSQYSLTDSCMPADSVARALAYLTHEQEEEGCWFGRWGVNYIYGTSFALNALAVCAPKGSYREAIKKGAKWLCQVQNKPGRRLDDRIPGKGAAAAVEDGGWGETCSSYEDPKLKGWCEASTATQTAWALQGLLAAGDALGEYEEDALHQGAKYLVSTQRGDGSWHEAYFTGTAFPSQMYVRYHLYAQHFPLSALSRYRERIEAGKLGKSFPGI